MKRAQSVLEYLIIFSVIVLAIVAWLATKGKEDNPFGKSIRKSAGTITDKSAELMRSVSGGGE